MAIALAELPPSRGEGSMRKSDAHILGFALAAGASDAFPVAGAIAVPMVQAAMLRQLGKLHGVHWDRRTYAEFAGALGTARWCALPPRSACASSSSSSPSTGRRPALPPPRLPAFAATYAMGKAAKYFLVRRQQGGRPRSRIDLPPTLRQAFHLAKERDIGTGAAGAKP
jgi:hypothetical protein